ncbi:hypothetical protein CBR_g28607 [Chara braunii]|uniref:Reverse transcriptase domain-containing protein n=1 Tax=Chara braunii TaxID=69332 RepID=A0A388L9I2_CHABU|nr:hypothetical protein CBR_g28607 [Chara braunii]|eukprot:GBG78892.1 hypothetical protein CBR_g28607 [Chara braunii]
MRRSQRLADRKSKAAKPQQGPKALQIPRRRRTAMAAAAGHADSNMPGSPKRLVPPPVAVQRADEDALTFLESLQQYTEANATELRTWEKENAARREAIRLQQEAKQAARPQAAADSAAAARQQQQQLEASQTQARFQAAMNLLNEEAAYDTVVRQQHFRATEEQEEPTEEERNRETTAVLIENLLYTCNWQQRELLAMRQVLIRHEGNFKAMDQHITALQADTGILQAADSQQQAINDRLQDSVDAGMAQLSVVESTGGAVSDSSPALAAQAKQLDERINHIVTSLGDISKFAGTSTDSSQLKTLNEQVQQRAAAKEWKMPNFKIEKFDDYHKKDPLQWWMAFNAEADVHHTPPLRRMEALYLQLIGGAQAFMTHMAVTLECTIATLQPTKHVICACLDKDKENVKRPGLGKLSTAGSVTTTLPNPPGSAALLAASLTSGDTAVVASSRIEFENYVVELVPLLNQPLHMQDSSVCVAVPSSDNEPVASPALPTEDPSTWTRLEDLDPLTVEDFQWLPLPSTGSLPVSHRNALMAHLLEYLHAAVPPPLTDSGVAVVDLHNYLAKIDREYATQRALIDCGATCNYISQDFMARVRLGPRVRRKSRPTHVTLADGHTQKSIDRCVDSVPVYFAPLACEAVSFDILDTKFDTILRMSWLQSEDHPVNFHQRTVHVRDRLVELVPCTVPLPHPSIGCHVVSAVNIRQSIRRNDIEEMSICFLHALPPGDQPQTDMSDPRIIELLDSYEDVFQAPAGLISDRPIRHGITLEDGAVPPRGCIYRMSEEELQVLRAQLDDLLAKGWIRPSCSPYSAPVLFVRKKNKDLRLCINYRKLNVQTIKNADPLPRIDDLLERLGGAKYFSKLDLNRTLDEHLEHLRAVLERLRIAKYKANRDKCEFAQQELEYLGHYVTPQGIRPLADKVQAIQDWSDLKCKERWDKDVRIRKEKTIVGDMVLLYDAALERTWSGKLANRWMGRYHVVGALSWGAYMIAALDGSKCKDPVAGVRLKLFTPRETPTPALTLPDPKGKEKAKVADEEPSRRFKVGESLRKRKRVETKKMSGLTLGKKRKWPFVLQRVRDEAGHLRRCHSNEERS